MTDQLERRLERCLSAQGEALPSLTDRTSEALSQPPRDRSVSRGLVAAIVAAAVAFAVVGGTVWLLGRASDSDGTEASAAPDEPVDLPVEWSRVEIVPDNWNLEYIATSAESIVAIGSPQVGGNRTGVWHSPDGISWERAEGFDGGTVVRGVIGGEFGFAATGLRLPGTEPVTTTIGQQLENGPVPTVWTSSNGLDWDEHALPLPPPSEQIQPSVEYYVRTLAGTDDFVVALGDEIGDEGTPSSEPQAEGQSTTIHPSRPVAWVSSNGQPWRHVSVLGWDGATTVSDAAASNGLAAVAVTHGGENPYSTVWVTDDGENYDLAHQFESGVLIGDLSGGPGGFVAILRSGETLVSVDGTTWEPTFNAPEGSAVGSLSGGEGGYTLILQPNGIDRMNEAALWESTVYTSTDGRTWSRVPGTEALGTGFAITQAMSWNDRIVAIGTRFDGTSVIDGPQTPEMWITTYWE